MAHGFLAYEPVSGESPLVNFAKKKLKEGLKGLWGKFQKTSGALVKSSGGQVQYDANPQGVTVKDVTQPEPAAKKMLSGSTVKALGAGTGSIKKQEPSAIPGGVDGGITTINPGGTFTDIPGISAPSGGLNAETFFKQAQTGVGPSGEYLTTSQRREAFIKSRQESVKATTSTAAPPISPDSGIDIVAAVNRNTQMIVSLVEAVKTQTKNDSNLVEKQLQGQETLMLRAASRQEEASLEQGNDLSGFMTPENFEKKKKQEKKKEEGSKLKEFFRGPNPFQKDEGCGCSPFMPGPGGRGPILGGPPGGGGLLIPDYVDQWRDMNRRPGSRLGGGGSVTRRAGGARRATRLATKIGGKGAGKAVAKGVGKFGLKKIPVLGALAGIAFGAERAMKGDWLGAGGELLSGIASIFPGIGTGISAGIDAGLMARDAGVTPFAKGGIVDGPTLGLLGESPSSPREGVFPLEGPKGKEVFNMFGEGVFQAQKENDKDYAKLQSMGMKQYYEREGGFKKMGEGLKDFFSSLAGGIASLLGGPANAATGNPADYLGGGDFSGSSGQDQAMNYFMSQGLSKEQAAGIVGNLMQESTAAIDPKAKNGSGHRGIAQWDKNRWANFEKFAKQKGLDVNTREAQLQWIMEEMRTGAGGLSLKTLKGAKNSRQAAELFLKQYERSGEQAGSAGFENRMKNAATLATRDISGGGGKGGGKIIEYLTGDRSSPGYRADHGGNNYHEHLAFATTQDRDRAMAALKANGIKIGSVNDGKHAKGSYHYKNLAFDVPAAQVPPGKEQALSAKVRAILSKAGFSGKGIRAATPTTAIAGGGEKPGSEKSASASAPNPKFNIKGAPELSNILNASNANTGTPIAAASQQVAMASVGGGTSAAPTVINNYYGGGGQQGGVNPNGVSPGIGMEQTGTAMFQELRIRALA